MIGVVIAIILIVLGIYLIFFSTATGQATSKNNFAKCLSEKGATFYGAAWCGHCQNQKALFGDSFKYVNYVECTLNAQTCQSAGVMAYPTWIINGQKYEGEMTIAFLAKLTECPEP